MLIIPQIQDQFDEKMSNINRYDNKAYKKSHITILPDAKKSIDKI